MTSSPPAAAQPLHHGRPKGASPPDVAARRRKSESGAVSSGGSSSGSPRSSSRLGRFISRVMTRPRFLRSRWVLARDMVSGGAPASGSESTSGNRTPAERFFRVRILVASSSGMTRVA